MAKKGTENLAEAMKVKGKEGVKAIEFYKKARKGVDFKKLQVKENPDNPQVCCPRCGRVTQADMLRNVSHLPNKIIGDIPFVCDGCWTRWKREGVKKL